LDVDKFQQPRTFYYIAAGHAAASAEGRNKLSVLRITLVLFSLLSGAIVLPRPLYTPYVKLHILIIVSRSTSCPGVSGYECSIWHYWLPHV